MKNIQAALTTIQPKIQNVHTPESLNNEPSINQIIYSYYRQFADEKNAIEATNLYIKNWLDEFNNIN